MNSEKLINKYSKLKEREWAETNFPNKEDSSNNNNILQNKANNFRVEINQDQI